MNKTSDFKYIMFWLIFAVFWLCVFLGFVFTEIPEKGFANGLYIGSIVWGFGAFISVFIRAFLDYDMTISLNVVTFTSVFKIKKMNVSKITKLRVTTPGQSEFNVSFIAGEFYSFHLPYTKNNFKSVKELILFSTDAETSIEEIENRVKKNISSLR